MLSRLSHPLLNDLLALRITFLLIRAGSVVVLDRQFGSREALWLQIRQTSVLSMSHRQVCRVSLAWALATQQLGLDGTEVVFLVQRNYVELRNRRFHAIGIHY